MTFGKIEKEFQSLRVAGVKFENDVMNGSFDVNKNGEAQEIRKYEEAIVKVKDHRLEAYDFNFYLD